MANGIKSVRYMSDRQFDRLSERQKQCLRLFYANLEIKEIAIELNLSPNTVKEHLRDARLMLHASRSMQAARLLIDHERDTQGVSPPSRVGLERNLLEGGVATEPAFWPAARNRYNLGFLSRIGLIVAIAFGVVAFAGALLSSAEAITSLFIDFGIDISDPPYRQ
jgi:DNA-binding CsgD family transcriptional regulator